MKDVETWTGKVAMIPGIGVFIGTSGDNKPHQHWAHQIAISFDSQADIGIFSDGRLFQGKGIWIPAGRCHKLKNARILCLYLDPMHDLCRTLLPIEKHQDPKPTLLEPALCAQILAHFGQVQNLQNALHGFYRSYGCEQTSTADRRLPDVIAALRTNLLDQNEVSRATLAALTGLSASRFSHWFSEQTGMPLRSYKKWLKLLMGFELSRKMTLTDAAVASGFSDQAHFCRTVTQAFGVPSSVIQRLLLSQ